jgi:hypothetical protein
MRQAQAPRLSTRTGLHYRLTENDCTAFGNGKLRVFLAGLSVSNGWHEQADRCRDVGVGDQGEARPGPISLTSPGSLGTSGRSPLVGHSIIYSTQSLLISMIAKA